MIKSEEFYEDIFINPNNLHMDLADGPMLVMKWGEILANAKVSKNNTEIDFGNFKANLRMQIISNPADFDLPVKPTVAAIDAAITLNPEHTVYLKKIAEMKGMIDKLTYVQKAFDYRKTSISDLVKLYLKGYGGDKLFEDDQFRELLKTPEVVEKMKEMNLKLSNYASNLEDKEVVAEKSRAEQTEALNAKQKKPTRGKTRRRARNK